MPWHLTESLSIPALSPVLRSTTLPQQGLGAVVALAVNCHEQGGQRIAGGFQRAMVAETSFCASVCPGAMRSGSVECLIWLALALANSQPVGADRGSAAANGVDAVTTPLGAAGWTALARQQWRARRDRPGFHLPARRPTRSWHRCRTSSRWSDHRDVAMLRRELVKSRWNRRPAAGRAQSPLATHDRT